MPRSILLSTLALVLGTLAACSSSTSGSDAGCQPETDKAFCVRLGKNCNLLNDFDNCGASRAINCGTCDGTCQSNICQNANASGTGSGGTTGGSISAAAGTTGGTTGEAAGGTTGGTGGSAGGTTGGTTTGAPGCAPASCPGYTTVISAAFVPGQYYQHADGTLDGLSGENVTLNIGVNPPAALFDGESYSYSLSDPKISVTGDSSGLIAANMAPDWESATHYLELTNGQVDLSLIPADQSGTFYTLEIQCGSEVNGGPLTGACTFASVAVRYFTGGNNLQDAIYSTSATVSFFALDGG